MYSVQFTQTGNRELQRLPAAVIRRAVAAIEKLAEDPRGSRKLAGTENDYRLRVGQYRVIYEVSDQEHLVVITRVRHRKDVYQ